MDKHPPTIKRRQFFQLAGVGTATALGVFLENFGIEGATQWLTGSPEYVPWLLQTPDASFERRRDYQTPGWLETSQARPGFLHAQDGGHQQFLHEMCMSNPDLREAVRQSLVELFSPEAPEYPKLGDFFARRVAIAKNVLAVNHIGLEPKWSDVLHVAIYTTAATLSPYFSREDMINLGVNPPDLGDNKDTWWFLKYHKNIPHLFPENPNTCESSELDRAYRCYGGDRAIHIAQHLFLAYMYGYSINNYLQDAKRIPRAASIGLNAVELIVEQDPTLRTVLLDMVGQFYWEKQEAQDRGNGNHAVKEDGVPIINGFDDPYVWDDLKANTLGLWMALRASRAQQYGMINEDFIGQFITDLNDIEAHLGQALAEVASALSKLAVLPTVLLIKLKEIKPLKRLINWVEKSVSDIQMEHAQ